LAPFVPHGVRTSRGSSRPGPAFPCPALPRPPHPDPRSTRRTIAPLLGPGWRDSAANPNFGKVESFCGGGLTGFWGSRVFCPTGRSAQLVGWVERSETHRGLAMARHDGFRKCSTHPTRL
jgi:hypothetical protein